MSHDIDTYLDDLRRALAGADPAVIHDALFDAEEHLRSEFAAAQAAPQASPFDADAALESIMEAYGTPQEVAAAYLEAEGRPATAGPPVLGENTATAVITAPGVTQGPGLSVASSVSWASFFGVVTDRRTWLSLLYMLVAFVTGIAYFTWVVTGVSLALGLAVLIIGIPFALFFLASVRGISFAEGRLVEGLLGVRMPRRPSFGSSDPSIVQRILYWLRDRRTWTTMMYLLLQLPLGVAYFVIVVTGLTTSLSLIVAPVIYAVGMSQHWTDTVGSVQYWTVNGDPLPPWLLPLAVLAGVALLFGTLHLIRLIGRLHGGYAKAMLVRSGSESPGASAQMTTQPRAEVQPGGLPMACSPTAPKIDTGRGEG